MKCFKLKYASYSHDQPLLLVNGGAAARSAYPWIRQCLLWQRHKKSNYPTFGTCGLNSTAR